MVNDAPIGHACGVFGVYAPGQDVAHLTYLGLYALQHRGQESAGIAVSDGQTITVSKDMGLVTQVFDERRLAPLDGHLAIGHVRYSTTGSSSWRNAQPVYRSVGDAGFALGHNGNLTNTVELAEQLGMLPGLVPGDARPRLHHRLRARRRAHRRTSTPPSPAPTAATSSRRSLHVLPQLEGGFSFVMMDEAHLIGVRDPHGFWPLVLGRVEGGWVLASETAALDIVGAHFVREVEPGEMIVIDASGVHTRALRRGRSQALPVRVRLLRASRHEALRPQRARGAPAHGRGARASGAGRRRHGDAGARVGDPRRAGLRARVGHPLRRRPGEEPLRRPHVHPAQPEAARPGRAPQAQPAAREHPGQEAGRGRRLDRARHHHPAGRADAARGGRGRGALPRVVAAVQWPCFYGMDTGSRSELLAADLSVGEIRDFLGVDSLAYLELDRLTAATGASSDSFCTACLSGNYPVPVPLTDSKLVLEDTAAPEPAPR